MTIDERLAAVEKELENLRERRKLETAMRELRAARQEGAEEDLRQIRQRTLPDLAKALKELEEAATVTAYQQAQLARQGKQYAEWLEGHTEAMRELDQNITKLSAAQLVTEEKLQGLIDAIRRGGNGSK